MHATAPGFELDSKVVGAFPLVNQILKRLRFDDILRKHLPPPDPRALLPTRSALGFLLRNLETFGSLQRHLAGLSGTAFANC